MILRMYSVYDIKSKIYHPPQFCHNTGHALRYFAMQFKETNSVMAQYPADFQIFEVGAYDDSTAEIQALQNPTHVANVDELLEAEKNDAADYR